MTIKTANRRSVSLSILGGIFGISVAGAAVAQSFDLGPDGLRIRPPEPVPDDALPSPHRYEPEAEDGISEDDAVSIARDEGVRRVDRVREGRRGWVIVGIDRNGDDIRIMINRRGEIVDIQRE
ncbi:MAG: hypothetical protein DCF30_22760 [Hyphomicrobiales bacterium]|nr:MAG: hypothetical protein DCF30_22760 [Hyphomicrobiales bacterium]